MATAQNKWYSFGAALRPRVQAQHPCELSTMFGSITAGKCLGVGVGLARERPDGYTEMFHFTLSNEELDRLWHWHQEMRRKYP